MQNNFKLCTDYVFLDEGGYSDHPLDPGGATNLGITIKTLERARKAGVTKQDVKNLTIAEATAIYREFYWQPVQADILPYGIDYKVYDFGINAGPSVGIKTLQRVLRVNPDGDIGEITLKALFADDPIRVINAYKDEQIKFYKQLGTWSTFGNGWTNRANKTTKRALAMITPLEKDRQKRIYYYKRIQADLNADMVQEALARLV